MLKSTHRPSSGLGNSTSPLPEGWTEHKAPTGHSYYYNSTTKQSTYTRPTAPPPTVESLPGTTGPSIRPIDPSQSFLQYQRVEIPGPNLGHGVEPREHFRADRGGHHNQTSRNGHDQRRDRRPQPVDKPKSKHPIPGCDPWILVHTKLGRRFVYNSDKKQSFWRIPDKLKGGILELDQRRIKEKAEAREAEENENVNQAAPGASEMPGQSARTSGSKQNDSAEDNDDSSEYEEVEVTDDEDEEGASKRQRTEESAPDVPVEFNEDDIAFQLAAMGQEYGLEPGEYDDGHMEDWAEGVEGLELTAEDSSALFKDLLNDSGTNPYSSWEKVVEDGKLVDDSRYTALTSMKARKEVWEEWSRERIKQLREQRAKEEKKDPRIPYMAFLQKNATPKLYWPEFKRKYRKEPEMRDNTLSDKDREKWYREHINRMKLPASTLKTDFLTLLKSQPTTVLNNATLASHLPPTIVADVRYISLDAATRDPLIEAFITTLPPPPETGIEETEEGIRARRERERREKALADRVEQVAEQKRQQKRHLEFGKGRLREEEAEIARAMNVTKKGLKDHLIGTEQAGSS
ncbi:MAG: hypothetical protein M1818_003429 [Claussenomyces sp. TS43310]|nr:MAG: hypothetical protein M1818_003429 [Claussenomyces sp. TS43310]